MRQKTSYADYLKDWQHLLATLSAIPELATSRNKATLETLVSQFGPLSTRQAQHQAAKQTATLELAKLVRTGLDVVRDLTAETKGHFGSRSEELVQFRVRPLREGRRAKTGAPEVPPSGGSEGPAAGAASGAHATA